MKAHRMLAGAGVLPGRTPKQAASGAVQALARTSARPVSANLFRSPHLLIGGLLIGALLALAVFGPALAPYPPNQIEGAARLQGPNLQHLFGTDAFGRDLFSRVLFGARIAAQTCLAAAAISAIPGTALGLVAGYRKGWLDQLLSRLMDAWLALPGLLLAIVLIARMGPSLTATIIALGVTGVPAYFRLARSSALTLSQAAYVETARSLGARESRILLRHILPNAASPLIVLFTLRLGTILLAVGGLSFIGLGAQPPQPEWGAMLSAGRDDAATAWWLMVFPGLALTLSVMGFNLLGDGLRDLFCVEDRQRFE